MTVTDVTINSNVYLDTDSTVSDLSPITERLLKACAMGKLETHAATFRDIDQFYIRSTDPQLREAIKSLNQTLDSHRQGDESAVIASCKRARRRWFELEVA